VRQFDKAEIDNALQTALRRGTSVVLATVSDNGEPSTAFCSWVISAGPQTIAIALDSRSTGYRNINAGRTQVAVEVMADDFIGSIRGRAAVVKDQLRSVPFPCALVAVRINEVRDHRVGGVIFKAPRYLFEDGKEHRGEVERAIFEELQETPLGGDHS
jgi:hypothetical protein